MHVSDPMEPGKSDTPVPLPPTGGGVAGVARSRTLNATTMKTTKRERIQRFYRNAESLGLSTDEADSLRRIEMTLHRWAELECGTDAGHIERDEMTGKPIFVSARARYVDPKDPRGRWFIPDRESGALRRLARILDRHPELIAYHQGDPRGCALYVLRKSDVAEGVALDSVYTRGWAVTEGGL